MIEHDPAPRSPNRTPELNRRQIVLLGGGLVSTLVSVRDPFVALAQDPTMTPTPEEIPQVYDAAGFAADVLASLENYASYPVTWYLDANLARENHALPEGETPRGWEGTVKLAALFPDAESPNGQGYSIGFYLSGFWFSSSHNASAFLEAEKERTGLLGLFVDQTGSIDLGSDGSIYGGSFEIAGPAAINRHIAVWRRGNVVPVVTWDFITVAPEQVEAATAEKTLLRVDKFLRSRRTERTVTATLPLFENPATVTIDPVVWNDLYLPKFGETEDDRANRAGFAGSANSYLKTSYQSATNDGAPLTCFAGNWIFYDAEAASEFFDQIPDLVGQSDDRSGVLRVELDTAGMVAIAADLTFDEEIDLSANVFGVQAGEQLVLIGVEARMRAAESIATAAILGGEPQPAETAIAARVDAVTTANVDEREPLNAILRVFYLSGGGSYNPAGEPEPTRTAISDEPVATSTPSPIRRREPPRPVGTAV